MKTYALDRFGTKLENRFIKNENLQYYRDPYKEISLFIKQDE